MATQWTLYDPVGSTTYTMDINAVGESPEYAKAFTSQSLVKNGTAPLMFEGLDAPAVFSITGTLLTESQYESLLSFYELRRQFRLTDDLGRVRWIYLTSFQPVRVRNALFPWKHTYTLSGYVVSETLSSSAAPAPGALLPTVTSLSPASGAAGGGTSVVVTGTNFTGTTSVTFGGVSASFVVNTSTQITATSPVGTSGAAVHVQVTATGTSSQTASDVFSYTAAPTVSAVSPTNGSPSGGTSVVITGTHLTGATAVKFGTTNAASFVVNNASKITAVSPADTGTQDITVTTPVATSATSSADHFTFAIAAPTVSGVYPSSGGYAGGQTVTVSGTGFTGATAVHFGLNAGTSLSVGNDTTLTVKVPAGSPAPPNTSVDVTVTNPGGTSTATNADLWTYNTFPVITSLSPSTGSHTGGTTVTITGSGFSGGSTTVNWNGSSLAFTPVSDTSITVVTPAIAAGAISVSISTGVGTSASKTFTYT